MPVFAPASPNYLDHLLAVSKNLAHPLHPAYDNGKGGGWNGGSERTKKMEDCCAMSPEPWKEGQIKC